MIKRSTAPIIDPEIFAQAKAGDESALSVLLESTQPNVRRYAARTCRAGDIDDAVQETLLLLYRRIGTVKFLGALPGWLFTVVKRECIRLMQQSSKHEGKDIGLSQNEELLSNMPEEALKRDLALAIHNLPEHYRHVILLRDMIGMSVEEIANKLELSRGSVKAQLHRARMRVRLFITMYHRS